METASRIVPTAEATIVIAHAGHLAVPGPEGDRHRYRAGSDGQGERHRVEGARGQLRGRGPAQRGFRQSGVFRPQQVPGDRAHEDAAGNADHRYR